MKVEALKVESYMIFLGEITEIWKSIIFRLQFSNSLIL